MKEQILAIELIPSCSFCENKAVHDSPTLDGPWAYTCLDCAPIYTTESMLEVGTKFVPAPDIPDDIKEMASKVTKRAHAVILLHETPPENIILESTIEVECPICGRNRTVEHDFDSTFICEGCGQRCYSDIHDDLCNIL